jgi:hypothetical protein
MTTFCIAFYKSYLLWAGARVRSKVRRVIRFEANMKRMFIRYEANKTGFIRLFRIEANRLILHAKRIKTEANTIICEYFEANIRQYEKIANVRPKANIRCIMYFFASNRIFVCGSVRIF